MLFRSAGCRARANVTLQEGSARDGAKALDRASPAAYEQSVSPENFAKVSLTGLSIALLARFFVGLIWSATYLLLRQRAVARQSTAAAVAAELRATQAEVALRESELARLSQHVEPHFLFNALSAVLACRHEPDAVEAVTASLSEYLRFCLARGKDLEPLAHELDATEQLLSVHEARFEEDLRCSVGASPAARRIAVPPMVVAPLLDNALKFARQTSEPPWEISVTARMTDDRLILTVANSGS